MRIIDAHTHVYSIEDEFAQIYALAERLRYDKLTVLSLQSNGDLLQNLICALCKVKHPGITYAFGGLDYITGRDYVSQVKNLREMGFDGVKMLEGKPTCREKLGMALDDPAYDGYYSYLEETGFPVLLHVADPGTFWDREKIPGWALEHGWFYDDSHVPYEQYYDEVEHMLDKHPRLRAIFAHFFFLSGEPERMQRFLDAHPLVSIDVTAGIEMYEDFSKDPAFWREFFIKNSGRIIYGTDSTDQPLQSEGEKDVSINGYAAVEIDFLRYDREIEIFGMKLHGIGLPQSALERIFASNYIEYAGDTPRLMDFEALKREAAFISKYLSDKNDVQKLNMIISKLNL